MHGWSNFFLVAAESGKEAIEKLIKKDGKVEDFVFYAYKVTDAITYIGDSVEIGDVEECAQYNAYFDRWKL